MEIRGILIDLDGTLIDTQIANMKAYNIALSEYGLRFSDDEFSKTIGMDSTFFLSKTFPSLSKSQISSIRIAKSCAYKQFLKETVLNRTLLSFLEQSSCRNKLGLVTTGKSQNVHEILDFHQLKSLFQVIITGDDVQYPKPNPEPYLKAIHAINLYPSEILVFEDSQSGIESAKSAGLQVMNFSGQSKHE